jgi:hypothetical protein
MVVVLFLCAVLVSLLWWRSDADLCSCEYCPDGYCIYARQIHTLLRETPPAPITRFLGEGAAYLHAHSPLAPTLVALLMFGGLGPMPAFAVLNVLATLLTWHGVRRIVEPAWAPRPVVVLQLAVALLANPIVIRSLARPVTDAVGMLCVVWTLAAIDEHLASRDRRSAARLLVLQIAGLASRVSFIPMLGMPALVALAEPGSLSERIRRAVRAGLVFGVLPALLFFGALHVLGLEHVRDAWKWAHQPEFVSQQPLVDFATSWVLAGGAWLVLGLLPLGEGREAPARRIHLGWAILYLAFLGMGRGALWPRYFLPIVPSVLIVATPALLALDRRSPKLAWVFVALCALTGGHALLRIRHPSESLALLTQSIPTSRERGDPGRNLTAVARSQIVATSSTQAATAPLVVDGRLDTAWSTVGPTAAGTWIALDLGRPRRLRALVLTPGETALLDGLVVDASLDGETWTRLPVTVERTDLFAERRRIRLRLPRRPVRHLRITATKPSAVAWTIGELEVRVVFKAARARSGGG